jgi:hypothetical protein
MRMGRCCHWEVLHVDIRRDARWSQTVDPKQWIPDSGSASQRRIPGWMQHEGASRICSPDGAALPGATARSQCGLVVTAAEDGSGSLQSVTCIGWGVARASQLLWYSRLIVAPRHGMAYRWSCIGGGVGRDSGRFGISSHDHEMLISHARNQPQRARPRGRAQPQGLWVVQPHGCARVWLAFGF